MHPDGYFALVLTPDSSELIRRTFATLTRPIAHHCTVTYGTRDPAHLPSAFSPADIGKNFRLKVRGFKTREDGAIQAAVVALVHADGLVVDEGFSENAIPHVTVATDGVAEPTEANELLADGFELVDGPTLEAALVHTYASSSA